MVYKNPTITNLIESLWETMGANSIANPIAVIEQIGYLLLIRKLGPKIEVKNIPSDYWKWENISRHIHEPNFRNHLQTYGYSIFSSYHTIFSGNIFDRSFQFLDKIKEVTGILDKLFDILQDEDDIPSGIESYIFESLLDRTALVGTKGQFRTPRHITNMMVELISPNNEESICDPAVGTGGFLLSACKFAGTKELELHADTEVETDADGFRFTKHDSWASASQISITGADNDKMMLRICVINLLLHGVEKFSIAQKNSIQNNFNESDPLFDVVLSNPPYGIKDKEASSHSKYGFNISELLFLEKIIGSLKCGGRCVVVVPEGILFNSKTQYRDARHILLTQTNLEAVISLPAGTFSPYTTGKSAILTFTKDAGTKRVWFYELTTDGYSSDRDHRRLKGDPLVDAVKDYKNRNISQNDRTQNGFFVTFQEIKENDFLLSYNTYREFTYKEQSVSSPSEILNELQKQEEVIMTELKKLANSIK